MNKKPLYNLLIATLISGGILCGALAETTTITKSNNLAYYGYRCYWSAYYGRRVCGYYHYNGYYNGYYNGGYYRHGYYGHGYYHHGYHHGYHRHHGHHHYHHHGGHHR